MWGISSKLHRAVGLLSLVLTLAVVAAGCAGQGVGSPANQPSASAGTGGGGSDAAPIRIGAVFDTTGGAAQYGIPQRNGAELMVKQINAAGGINGQRVELVTIDSESQETKAVLAVRRLIDEEKVIAIVGGSSSGASLAMIDYVEKKGVPFVSVGSSARITDPVKQWVFKTPQSERLAMEKLFDFLKANNITKVGWISLNNAFGDSGRDEYERLVPAAGVTTVGSERFNDTDNDVTPQLSTLKSKEPEAVLAWAAPPAGSIMVKNYQQIGMTAPLLLSHGMISQALFDQAGDAAEGAILPGSKVLVADSLPDTDPQKSLLLEFAAAYEADYKERPVPFASYGYDSILLLAEAIKKAGTDPAKIRDTLENDTKGVVGTTGVFTFSPTDHNGLDKDSLVLLQVKQGNWALYEPGQ